MPTNIYWIHTFKNAAKIGIMARPRGGDWLEDEINNLKRNNVAVLVSLLEKQEIDDLKLELEEEICRQKNIDFIHFPIADRGVPDKHNDTDQLIATLRKNLSDGDSVLIHCRMGIGRSSIIAGAVLQTYNFNANEIIEIISFIRRINVPDTEKQLQWLKAREL